MIISFFCICLFHIRPLILYQATIFSIFTLFSSHLTKNPYLCHAKTGITTRQGRMSHASKSSRIASGACEIRQSSTKAMSLQAPCFFLHRKTTNLSYTLRYQMQEFCRNFPQSLRGTKQSRGCRAAAGESVVIPIARKYT